MIKRAENKQRWIALPIEALEDGRLSWKARGLLAFILAKPDDWEIRREHLMASSDKDGETSVKSALKELVEHGYAALMTQRDEETGQVEGRRYCVYDTPKTRRVENPIVGKPLDGETAPIILDPVLPRSKRDLDPEEHTQNARACEEDFPETEQPKDAEQTVGYGEEGESPLGFLCDATHGDVQCDFPVGHLPPHRSGVTTWIDRLPNLDTLQPVAPPGRELGRRLDTGAMVTTGAPPDACTAYHPGFPCGHEQASLHIISDILWDTSGQQKRRLKSHHSLHAFIHESLETYLDDVRTVAAWWREHRKPKDWTIPLMFSRPGEVLANAHHTEPEATPEPKPTAPAFRTPAPEPPTEDERVPVEEIRELLGPLTQKFNADAVTEAQRTRPHDPEAIRRYVEEESDGK